MNGPKGIFSEIPYWPFVALQKLLKIKIPANFWTGCGPTVSHQLFKNLRCKQNKNQDLKNIFKTVLKEHFSLGLCIVMI